jgi:hypothetical protein
LRRAPGPCEVGDKRLVIRVGLRLGRHAAAHIIRPAGCQRDSAKVIRNRLGAFWFPAIARNVRANNDSSRFAFVSPERLIPGFDATANGL